jgi:hypothetical protein
MVKNLRISFIRTFIGIGNNCNYCFLSYEGGEVEKGLEHKRLVKKDLKYISSSSTNNQQEIAKEASRLCDKCDYKDNYVFHFLEKNNIKAS